MLEKHLEFIGQWSALSKLSLRLLTERKMFRSRLNSPMSATGIFHRFYFRSVYLQFFVAAFFVLVILFANNESTYLASFLKFQGSNLN